MNALTPFFAAHNAIRGYSSSLKTSHPLRSFKKAVETSNAAVKITITDEVTKLWFDHLHSHKNVTPQQLVELYKNLETRNVRVLPSAPVSCPPIFSSRVSGSETEVLESKLLNEEDKQWVVDQLKEFLKPVYLTQYSMYVSKVNADAFDKAVRRIIDRFYTEGKTLTTIGASIKDVLNVSVNPTVLGQIRDNPSLDESPQKSLKRKTPPVRLPPLFPPKKKK